MSVRLLGAFALAGLFAAGCTVNAGGNPTRTCSDTVPCATGTCDRGFCVEGDAGERPDVGIDGGRDANADTNLPDTNLPDTNVDANVDAFVPVDANEDAATITPCGTDTDCGDDGDSCNGLERCILPEGYCDFGMAQDDGTLCDRDGMPGTRDLCVDGACEATQCGDGFTDTTTGELCDDGNDILGDGCDDCRYSCTLNSACANSNECDGAEICDLSVHACRSGTPPGDGMDCREGRGTCMDEECIPDSCTTGADCNDLDECNGVETCDTGTMLCVAGTAMDCGDGDSCTVDTCTRGLGCANTLMDGDRDGIAPRSCAGPSGDCNDADANVYPGAPEICGDGIDNNCSGDTTDERDFWYADCDEDGYAATGAEVGHSCSGPPAMAPVACLSGGWTAREPTADPLTLDCNDDNDDVHPGQTTFQTTAIAGAPAARNYDYNCDGVETPRSTTVGVCSGGLGLCNLSQGWLGGVPACGAEVQWILTCAGLGCTRGSEPRVQACL